MNISEIIFDNYALKEIQGPEENTPEIVAFFKEVGHSWVKNDELAWCAAFANAMLIRADFPHTGKLNARSFLDLGELISNPLPYSNACVKLSRPAGFPPISGGVCAWCWTA